MQVCKYFLDAVEKEIYGWFWTCPNGGDACKYRHALPPGYVFKSKKQREAEAAAAAEPDSGVSIEEEIEQLVCTRAGFEYVCVLVFCYGDYCALSKNWHRCAREALQPYSTASGLKLLTPYPYAL